MISHLEGVLLQDVCGICHVVSTGASNLPERSVEIPPTMHPLAVRGSGRRYQELERHALAGAKVMLTIESDPVPSILEIDEIAEASSDEISAARSFLANARTMSPAMARTAR